MKFILTSWSDIDGHCFDEFNAADWDAATAHAADILSNDANEAVLHQVIESRCVDVLPIHAKRQADREERERQAQEAKRQAQEAKRQAQEAKRQAQEAKRLKAEAAERAEYNRLRAKFEGGQS